MGKWVLTELEKKLLLAEPTLNPNSGMVWGTCQHAFTQHDSRMGHHLEDGTVEVHKEKASSLPWINREVEAGTRTVKGLDLSKGPKLQPHIISCWRLEDFMRKNFGGRIGLGAVALGS